MWIQTVLSCILSYVLTYSVVYFLSYLCKYVITYICAHQLVPCIVVMYSNFHMWLHTFSDLSIYLFMDSTYVTLMLIV